MRISADVVRQVDSLGRTASRALGRYGLETGGLLVGSQEPSLRLESVQIVEIEHRFGPSYQLSDSDVELYRRSISGLSSSGHSVIGHFRIFLKGKSIITPADRTISALTGAAQPLTLLIHAYSDQPGRARLYRNRGNEYVELLEFPLRHPIAPGLPPPFPVLMSPVDAPMEQPAQANEPARRRRVTPVLVVAAVIAVSASIDGYLWLRTPLPKPAPSSSRGRSSLGLSVHRLAGRLNISWDQSSPQVRNAVSGVLTIHDGVKADRLPLTPEQLRSTLVPYVPENDTVNVQLEVQNDRHQSSSETVLVVTGPQLAELDAPTPEAAGPVSTHREPRHQGTKPLPVPRMEPSPRRRMERPQTPHSSGSQPVALPPMELPTAMATERQMTQLPQLGPLPDLAPSRPPVRLPPPAQAAGTVSYDAPVPLRKVSPAVPTNLRSLIQEDTSLEVEVRIDAEGKVLSATPLNAANSSQKLVSSSAVQAALLWRFEPARRNQQPVPSVTVLRFDFARRAR
jgi:hypothetical protein